MPSNPRNANGTARRKLRMRLAAEGRPCWICRAAGKSGTIDYSLRFPHPYSFVADEKVPVSRYWLGGYPNAKAAALDYGNLLAAHKCCNEWRGNRTVEEVMEALREKRKRGPRAIVHASRDWRHPNE